MEETGHGAGSWITNYLFFSQFGHELKKILYYNSFDALALGAEEQ